MATKMRWGRGGEAQLEERLCFAAMFVPQALVASSSVPIAELHTLDFDRDRDIDIVIEAGPASWLQNLNGRGDFAPAVSTQRASATRRGDYGDIDGDGELDVVSAVHVSDGFESYNQLSWFKSGTGTPRQLLRIPDSQLFRIELVDVDGDQDQDALLYTGDFLGILSWFENTDGRGRFSSPKPLRANAPVMFGIDVDLDGDGDLLKLPQLYTNPHIIWAENQNGTFVDRTTLVPGVPGPTGDFDGDGDVDLLGGTPNSSFGWYENESVIGAIRFERFHPIPASSFIVHREIVDLEGDGDLDIVENRSTSVAWYENVDGQGQFATPKELVAGLVDSHSLRVADVDGDLDQDLILWTEDRVMLYAQRSIGDANDDGVFNSADLVAIFIAGEYEDTVPGNSTFGEGDWNLDGEFDSADLILAAAQGQYEAEVAPSTRVT